MYNCHGKKVFYRFFLVCSLHLKVFRPPPPSQNKMSKLFFFIFLEFLWKSNVKKWSQIWKLLLIKGVKSPLQTEFFLQIVSFVHSNKTCFCSHFGRPISKLFILFFKSLGKSNGKKLSQIWKLLLVKDVKLPPKKNLKT